MPRLMYCLDLTVPPLDLAAQALTVARAQDYARTHSLGLEEREAAYSREYVLTIPAARMNDILWDLDLAGLLKPNQQITGDPALHAMLEERFSWLLWVDSKDQE